MSIDIPALDPEDVFLLSNKTTLFPFQALKFPRAVIKLS